jgi:hypothetical protein
VLAGVFEPLFGGQVIEGRALCDVLGVGPGEILERQAGS